jgi:hypothetical protein
MYETFASLMGGLAAAVTITLLAEKAARHMEANAQRRADREQSAN